MPDSKSIFFSKTFWGVLIMTIAPVLKHFHITLGSDDADTIATALVTIAGAAWAIYGRIKAAKAVHVIAPPPSNPTPQGEVHA